MVGLGLGHYGLGDTSHGFFLGLQSCTLYRNLEDSVNLKKWGNNTNCEDHFLVNVSQWIFE